MFNMREYRNVLLFPDNYIACSVDQIVAYFEVL